MSRPTAGAWLALILLSLATAMELLAGLQQSPETIAPHLDRLFAWSTLGNALVQLAIVALFIGILQLGLDESFEPLGLPSATFQGGAPLKNAIGLGLLFFVVLSWLIPTILTTLFPALQSLHPDILQGMVPDLGTLARGLLIVTIAGALREELWRIAFLRAFERVGGNTGLLIGTVLGSIAFGLVHYYQGVLAVASTMAMGVALSLLWWKNRDLGQLIVIHTVHNAATLVLVYVAGISGN